MLTFTTILKERAPVSKQGYYHQRIPTEKFRFIGIKIYNLTERINQEGALTPRHPHQRDFLRDVT